MLRMQGADLPKGAGSRRMRGQMVGTVIARSLEMAVVESAVDAWSCWP